MQPFDGKTGLAIILTGVCFTLTYYVYRNLTGLHWMVLRSITFLTPFAIGAIWLKLSPDVMPVWQTVKKRLGFQ
jgi:drug/metabolite transporter (DMT)-like permease